MAHRTLRGVVAVAGIGETAYCKRGEAKEPEFVLGLRAILAACADAGIDARDVDGFASYSNDRNEPSRIAAALGCRELTFSNMQWGGGGGGGSALAQGQFGRFGAGARRERVSGDPALWLPYGLMSPAQMFAMRAQRLMHEHGIRQEAFRAVALASYQHAQKNPRAVMYGRPLTAEAYDASRWIVEPFHLYDCCLENDGAAALILVSAERARDLRQPPAYLLGAAQGSERRAGAGSHNNPDYATASFKTVAPRLYEMAGVKPADVDVVQSYENFTGGVVMSLVEHGFFGYDEANEFCTLANFSAPDGRLPLNTSGGNLAECYMHGLELQLEAVRQIRGQSTAQVPVSDMILASEDAL